MCVGGGHWLVCFGEMRVAEMPTGPPRSAQLKHVTLKGGPTERRVFILSSETSSGGA